MEYMEDSQGGERKRKPSEKVIVAKKVCMCFKVSLDWPTCSHRKFCSAIFDLMSTTPLKQVIAHHHISLNSTNFMMKIIVLEICFTKTPLPKTFLLHGGTLYCSTGLKRQLQTVKAKAHWHIQRGSEGVNPPPQTRKIIYFNKTLQKYIKNSHYESDFYYSILANRTH